MTRSQLSLLRNLHQDAKISVGIREERSGDWRVCVRGELELVLPKEEPLPKKRRRIEEEEDDDEDTNAKRAKTT